MKIERITHSSHPKTLGSISNIFLSENKDTICEQCPETTSKKKETKTKNEDKNSK